jgi:hypothetical protein
MRVYSSISPVLSLATASTFSVGENATAEEGNFDRRSEEENTVS